MLDLLLNTQFAILSLFLLSAFYTYFLWLLPFRFKKKDDLYDRISVIIPARNEASFIEESVSSVLNAKFTGEKQIIVVDDCSQDKTYEVLLRFGEKIQIISNSEQMGKAKSLNKAMAYCESEVVFIIDGDSVIHPDSLNSMLGYYCDAKVASVSGMIRAKNPHHPLVVWQNINLITFSYVRFLQSKINAMVTTPGPLSSFRKSCLDEIGGFSSNGFSEDAIVCTNLIRRGYKVITDPCASSETYMPTSIKGYISQQTRWTKGLIFFLRNYTRLGLRAIDLISIPYLILTYFNSLILGPYGIYVMFEGFNKWIVAKGYLFSLETIEYFHNYATLGGAFKYIVYTVEDMLQTGPPYNLSKFVLLPYIVLNNLFIFIILIKTLRKEMRSLIIHMTFFYFLNIHYWIAHMLYIFGFVDIIKKEQPNIWEKHN